jgi:putative colanic acid biosynthesis UDP-glucose lipid carrier transferase
MIGRLGIQEVWVCLPLKMGESVYDAMYTLRHSTVDIRYIPDFSDVRLLNHKSTEVAGIYALDLSCTPMNGINLFLKSLEDRLLGLLIFTLVAPLLLVIAIGVKLSSPGPVIFKQYRHGVDGQKFRIYKFRSMRLHQEDQQNIIQAKQNDSRITSFGRFIRKTSLDELPQFFNVIQGKMSIVGPRPHALSHNEYYKDLIESYMKRHKVKPGITGWAQVNGFRGETDSVDKMAKRVEYDLYYIENWSLMLDIKIILMTFIKGFFNKNAY